MFEKIIYALLCFFALGLTLVFGINFYIKNSTKSQIKDMKEVNVDAIVVLGASIRTDGSLSPMLKDRLIAAIEAYNNGVSSKIIMSGDHSSDSYDEVTAMKKFAVENGVKSEDVYLDHSGFSTYDSIYRMKYIFKLDNIAIVTQKYHLYRALYIANKLDIEAVGIDATKKIYSGQNYRDFRELLARNKDFIKAILKPDATYIGDSVDINASGDLTN